MGSRSEVRQELISIREAGRRMGVSDTAVRKAIASGRVTIAARTKGSDRPLLAWPAVKDDWERNSDPTTRTHVGPRSGAAAPKQKPLVKLPTNTEMAQQQESPGAPQGPSIARSRAIREAYQAQLAKLEYEQKSGKLIDADEAKIRWFKLVTAAKTRILGIPAACKARAADLPLSVVDIIDQVCREALEDLANERD